MPRAKKKPSNVASIWGNTTDIPNPEPDQEVVGVLEEMLARAKDGQILGMHYACIEPGRIIGTGFVGKAERGVMLTAITQAFLRYGRAYIED
jgi:hypothetical protein